MALAFRNSLLGNCFVCVHTVGGIIYCAACICACIWRPDANLRNVLQKASTLCLETGSFSGLEFTKYMMLTSQQAPGGIWSYLTHTQRGGEGGGVNDCFSHNGYWEFKLKSSILLGKQFANWALNLWQLWSIHFVYTK